MAHDFFPGEDPIGQPLSRVIEDDRTTLIVGVVSNAITMRLRERSEAAIYHPIADRKGARLLIRTASPSSQVAAVRTALQSLDNRVRLDVVPVAEGLDRQLSESRVLASLAATLAGVALCLAVVGLHGVTTFVVSQRRQEIALRVALGATDRDVLRLLLGDSLRPVTIGLGAGVLIALAGSRVIAGALYGVGPSDPIAFAASVAILLAVGVAGDSRSRAPGHDGRSRGGVEVGVGHRDSGRRFRHRISKTESTETTEEAEKEELMFLFRLLRLPPLLRF